MGKTALIVLAAGNSSRMGEPKQLLLYKNKTLLQHILDEGKRAALDPVICVTGFQSDMISESINDRAVHIVYNENWREGMGSGISAGIKHLPLPDVDSVILAVSDQPFVSSELFRKMLQRKGDSGKGIIACAYAGTVGTPVCFEKKYFDDLEGLNGNEGAKSIVKQNDTDLSVVNFEKGRIDIDTREDYEKLISN